MTINLKKLSLLFIFSVTIFLTSFFTKNLQNASDPLGTLLTSQAIIETKSVKLDNYTTKNMSWHLLEHNNHRYYYFPLGSSLSSIPFVYVATKFFNFNMNKFEDDKSLQKIITSILSIVIFILLYKIASVYLEYYFAVFLSVIFWLGTSLSSTLATALWNQSFAVVYTLISIYLLLLIVKQDKHSLWPYLSFFLFMSYLTRPTLSLLSIVAVLYIYFSAKRVLSLKVAFLVFFLLGVFVLFSFYEYNQIVPPYYMPKRLNSDVFWTAFYGNLLSPARGIFIYSPFLLIFFLNIDKTISFLNKNKLLYLFLAWIIIHLIIISKFPQWWGGGSYGPRFMIDVLVPFFLLFILLIKELLEYKGLRYKFNMIFLSLSFSLAIWINSYQGLYNPYTIHWFLNPNIDKHPEYLFDWRYPQFLHNKTRHEKRLKEFSENQLSFISFNSKEINYLSGWSHLEKNHVWSIGKESQLSLELEDKKYKGKLKLSVTSLGAQEIKIFINNHYVDKFKMSSRYKISIKFDPKILNINNSNIIKFVYSNPHKPNNGDQRVLAMALKSISIK